MPKQRDLVVDFHEAEQPPRPLPQPFSPLLKGEERACWNQLKQSGGREKALLWHFYLFLSHSNVTVLVPKNFKLQCSLGASDNKENKNSQLPRTKMIPHLESFSTLVLWGESAVKSTAWQQSKLRN